ncbi:MAG: Hsp70 family protein [Cyanobacteria bacterium J06626_6]
MYAIDFGTSNTVVARWNETTQTAETLSLPALAWQLKGNPPLVPSLLYVEQVETMSADGLTAQASSIAGQAVRDRGLDLASDPRFFRNFKRGIGTAVQGFMPELDGHVISFEQVGGWFLQQVVGQLKAQDPALDSLVFTVPVDSFEAYRLWLGEVCKSLGVAQVRLLDEPTAAALGYQLSPAQRTLLVVDFGGGTLDFSLVQPMFSAEKPPGFLLQWGRKSRQRQSVAKRSPTTVRVLAKAGENLGGADIDRWLADHFAQTQLLPVTSLTLRLVEKLKIALSTAPTASEAYFDEETLDTYDLSLDREQFEQILAEQGFFTRLDNRLDQVLQQAQRQNISAPDIDAVLLVGGSAQIPAVKSWVARHFDPSKIRGDRPFEAVAQGALQLQTTQLQDFLYHGYGIRYWDRRNNAHSWHPIIQRGQPYPMAEPVEFFLGASSENQPSIELIIGELGDRTSGSMEVYFEGEQLVTRRANPDGTASQAVQPLNDREGARTIAKLSPPGFPGSDRIRILFSIDANRFLRMTVEDLLTSETLLSDQAVVQLS